MSDAGFEAPRLAPKESYSTLLFLLVDLLLVSASSTSLSTILRLAIFVISPSKSLPYITTGATTSKN